MARLTAKIYFISLAVVAAILLWGVGLANGTVKALILASWRGRFEDGTPFQTIYTGIFLIDFPISLLVAFFFYGTNGTDLGYQYFLIDAYGSLQSAFVWLYAESIRQQPQSRTVNSPIIWGLLWQIFGAAISLPLYYLNHLEWSRALGQSLPHPSLAAARALPISFFLGAVVPAVIGMLPTWVERDATTHQLILAAWQPDPVWVAAIQAMVTSAFARLPVYTSKADTEKTATWWIRLSYLLAATSSAITHIYAVGSIAFSSKSGVNMARIYLPHLLTGPAGTDGNILLRGPWLFLQYDLIIIGLSSVSWAYLTVKDLIHSHACKFCVLPLMLMTGSVVVGPGASVSMVLFWREGLLHSLRSRNEATPAGKGL